MEVSLYHESLLKRSEALHQLVCMIRDLPMELMTPPPKLQAPPCEIDRYVALPEVNLVDHWLVCGDRRVDLSRKALMRRLLSCFITSPNYEVSREALVHRVYAERNLKECSDRLLESLQQNTVKLISRARELLELHFDSRAVDWLVYSQDSRNWQLYRLKNDFLLQN